MINPVGQENGSQEYRKDISEEEIKVSEKTVKIRSSKNKKLRKLNYNPAEIVNAILQTVNSKGAGITVIRANSKLANLMGSKGSGQFEEAEISRAVGHAKKMVRCAKLRRSNFEKEEKLKQRMEELEESKRQQELQEMREELSLRKKKHRAEEYGKIDEANRSYNKEQSGGSVACLTSSLTYLPDAASGELSTVAVPLETVPSSSVNICL